MIKKIKKKKKKTFRKFELSISGKTSRAIYDLYFRRATNPFCFLLEMIRVDPYCLKVMITRAGYQLSHQGRPRRLEWVA